MGHAVRQLQAAQDFEDFIDAQSGGDGLGWFRIVRTPQEARDAVRAGKLAVTLGLEVDNLFNCKEAGCPPNFGLPIGLTGLPAPQTLNQAVDVIYALGVRHVFPIHNFDNGFGASATWMDSISVAQAVSEGRWWETRDCGTGRGGYGFWLDNVIQTIFRNVGFPLVPLPSIPWYINGNLEPDFASCNVRGLQPLGEVLLRLLMNKGILIDIDHMGANSLDETIAITSGGLEGNGPAYPLVASHMLAFDLHPMAFTGNRGRHERMRTRAQLDAIRNGGGMVAAMLKDDVQDTDLKGSRFTLPHLPFFGPQIPDNCRHSSKSWAQLFTYSVDIMGGPVAMGSDWNGAAGHLGPRFGSEACGGWGAKNGFERPAQEIEGKPLEYPFTLAGFGTLDRQVTGFKTFDYNVDGLAHIGLVPDMIADLQRLGMGQHYVDQLFCSSEAYIRVWERADAIGARRPVSDPNRPWLCNVTDSAPPESIVSIAPLASASGWHNGDVSATITASDADSGVEKIDYSVTAAPVANGPVAGDLAVVTIAGEGDRHLWYFATDVAGNVESPNAVTVRIDRTAPEITASRTPANAAGWNNGPVAVEFACTDALSGVDTCAAAQTLGTEGAGQSASGDAVDHAANAASASLTGINIDLYASGRRHHRRHQRRDLRSEQRAGGWLQHERRALRNGGCLRGDRQRWYEQWCRDLLGDVHRCPRSRRQHRVGERQLRGPLRLYRLRVTNCQPPDGEFGEGRADRACEVQPRRRSRARRAAGWLCHERGDQLRFRRGRGSHRPGRDHSRRQPVHLRPGNPAVSVQLEDRQELEQLVPAPAGAARRRHGAQRGLPVEVTAREVCARAARCQICLS